MWIRAVIIEDEPLAVEYLGALLDDTYQVEVVGAAAMRSQGMHIAKKAAPKRMQSYYEVLFFKSVREKRL
jgi:DNA-binding NarL/FixJ family response regulator